MGSNQSHRAGQHSRPYSRTGTARSSYSDMSTVTRNKRSSARLICERKCRFLGRFYAKELSEANLSRLRNHIRLAKGQKTKLRLTTEGIGSGSKFGTIFKNKLPAEFTPLPDIIDIFTDNRYSNILCIAMNFPDGNYEIQTYRMFDEATARQFQYAYTYVLDRLQPTPQDQTVHIPVNHVFTDLNTTGQSNGDNWMLKDNEPVNGTVPNKKYGLRKTTSLHDAFDTTDNGIRGGYSPAHNRTGSSFGFISAKGNIGKKLADVSAKDVDYNHYTATAADDDSDHMSQDSNNSNEELRWRLQNLSREVDNLRTTFDTKQTAGKKHNTSMMNGHVKKDLLYDTGKPRHYIINHHRDLDDKWSDDASDMSGSDIMDGRLVDYQAGTVKARVGDYRVGYHGNTNQSNSHAYNNNNTGGTKIGQGRRTTGDIDFLKHNGSNVTTINPNDNHLVYGRDTREIKRTVPSSTWLEQRSHSAMNGHTGRKQHKRTKSADAHRSVPKTRVSHSASEYAFSPTVGTVATARVSRPVERIYLPTGGPSKDYYVIQPQTNGVVKHKYAHSVIGAPRYENNNSWQ